MKQSINQSLAGRSEDDGLYEATIDGGGLACGDEVVPTAGCPYSVLIGKDDGSCET
jgi:hypothetical protein